MASPEKVTDLRPDQLVSRPVVYIDYDRLPGLPAEAQEALLKAVSVFESFSASPSPREQAVAYRRPLTDSEADRALKIAQDDWVRLSEQYDRAPRSSLLSRSTAGPSGRTTLRSPRTGIVSDHG